MSFGWALVTETDADNPTEGDLQIVNRALVRLTSFGDRVVQSVRVHFRWWRNEWFLDTRRGVPYLEEVLGQRVSDSTLRALVRREAVRVFGVAAAPVVTISRDPVSRQATADFEVLTTEGELVEITDVALGRR